MSIKTWKEVAYPVEAQRVLGKLKAVDHSILKWSHLDAPTLERYGLVKTPALPEIRDPETYMVWMSWVRGGGIPPQDTEFVFRVGETSCALCYLYAGKNRRCGACPLRKVLGAPCDHGGVRSVYGIWTHSGDTGPMVEALKKARGLVLEEMG